MAVAVRRDVTGQNFPGVQPRERSLDVQPPKTRGRKMRIRGLKFPRADVAPMSPRRSLTANSRGPHTRAPRESGGKRERGRAGRVAEVGRGTRGRLHERVT